MLAEGSLFIHDATLYLVMVLDHQSEDLIYVQANVNRRAGGKMDKCRIRIRLLKIKALICL